MKKEENILEQECCDVARKMGLACVKLEKNGNTGIPDRMFIAKGGQTLYIEFKRVGGTISREQMFWAEFLGQSHRFIDDRAMFMRSIISYFDVTCESCTRATEMGAELRAYILKWSGVDMWEVGR